MAEGTLTEPAYVAQLTTTLEQRLPGSKVQHEHVRSDRYRFVVIWDHFDQMEHPERQQLVWDAADEALPKQDLRKVSMILTLGLEDFPSE